MGSSRVKKPKYVTQESFDLFADEVVNFTGVTSIAMNQIRKELNDIKNPQPIMIYDIGQLSEKMLNDLKNCKPNPVSVSTPPPPPPVFCRDHNIPNHMVNGKPCCVKCTTPGSQWRTDKERCMHTLYALKNAFRFIHGIKLEHGDTVIIAKVRCQGRTREINLGITKNDITMTYYRRSGQYMCEHYDNTTQAAAAMTAICMYYATR